MEFFLQCRQNWVLWLGSQKISADAFVLKHNKTLIKIQENAMIQNSWEQSDLQSGENLEKYMKCNIIKSHMIKKVPLGSVGRVNINKWTKQ